MKYKLTFADGCIRIVRAPCAIEAATIGQAIAKSMGKNWRIIKVEILAILALLLFSGCAQSHDHLQAEARQEQNQRPYVAARIDWEFTK